MVYDDKEDKFFSGLNDNQIEAIKTTEGYVRIIAGAGSGKTRVLTNRYAYIVEKLGISPKNILCVTFTNRAAKEMKNRIQKLLAFEPINDFICTFHGFCVRVLREDINVLKYPKSFTILDEEDQKTILREIYENLNITSSDITYQNIIKQISKFKNLSPSYIEDYIDNSKEIKVKKNMNLESIIILEYIRIQKKNFALDFDDLMMFTLYIFDKQQKVLEKWQNKFEYVMVDETQDNSQKQWIMADLISSKCQNLFIVGDPDQCIYEWRGAMPIYLVDFDKNYENCKTVILNQNYRSYQRILDIANSVIVNNSIRISKEMFTELSNETTVIHFHAKSDMEEAKWVSDIIKSKIQNGININEIAILYRATFISRSFEQALVKNEIPYIIYGGIRFFERKEIKDALAYLRLIANGDDISFKRIINTPSRKIGKIYIQKIQELADAEKTTLYEALKNHVNDKGLDKSTALEFIEIIEYFKNNLTGKRISDILQGVLEKTNLLEAIRKDGDEERIENLDELMQSIKTYEQSQIEEDDTSLIKYLQDIALYTNIDYKNDNDFLKLMTIHQSKGLEFDIVFIVGMTEGIFPSHRSIRERRLKALEEERRLAYVAITRAKKELFLTESEGYSHETGDKYPSRFIYEITDTLIKTEGVVPMNLKGGLGFYVFQSKKMFDQFEIFNENEIINHPIFGDGKIITVEEDHYNIYFSNLNKTKPVIIGFKGLKKIDNCNNIYLINYQPVEITIENNSNNKQIINKNNIHKTNKKYDDYLINNPEYYLINNMDKSKIMIPYFKGIIKYINDIITCLSEDKINEFILSDHYKIFEDILNDKADSHLERSVLENFISYIDKLLEDLPNEIIEDFGASKLFTYYKKIFDLLSIDYNDNIY